MLWLPLAVSILYLIFTIILFAFGPIVFDVSQPFLLYGYMSIYLFSIFSGYIIGIILASRIATRKIATVSEVTKHKLLFFLFIFGAILASSITLHLSSVYDMLRPKFWWDTVVSSLLDLQGRYVLKMEVARIGQSNKMVNVILFIFAPFKILFISLFIAFWSKIHWPSKTVGIIVIFIVYLLPALNTGTNKPFFDLFIFTIVSLVALKIIDKQKRNRSAARNRIIIFVISLILSVSAFVFFSMNMEARGGQSVYIESTSPKGDIRVRPEFRYGRSRTTEAYVWFVSYLVQGYYGLSLSLQQDFTSTYGVGSSIFLTRQVKDILGINLFSRTYQAKISPVWDENAQWHSFYSYIANDVGFLGVTIVCFILGAFLALVWYTFILQSNFWSYLLLPLLALLVIFIPANNQVFGFLESFSSFFFVLIIWLASIKIHRKGVMDEGAMKTLFFIKK